MAGFKELLFISDDSDTATTVQCHDFHLGARVMTYKNGRGVARNTLSFVGNDYLITAEASKPFLHVWSPDKEDPVKRISMPGKVTAMAVSPNGIFCAAGIENKMYVWNVASGQLLNVVSYHHEPITRIDFWNCCYLVTSGADGLVAVWRLVDIVSKETGDVFSAGQFRHAVPFFSSSQHSLPVTDVHLASGGSTARLFTVSADQTCQVFSLGPEGGRFLLTVTFDYVLNSVMVDRLQRWLFVGTDCGRIICYPLERCYDATVRHVDSSSGENYLFGHSAPVNCLSLSRNDSVLASGSSDKKVILWNLSTRQQIGIHETFGSVTDVAFRVVTDDFFASNSKPKCLISVFERTVVSEPENVEIRVLVQDELIGDELEEVHSEKSSTQSRLPALVPNERTADSDKELNNGSEVGGDDTGHREEDFGMEERGRDSSTVESEIVRLRKQNRQLRKINRSLYMYALDHLWQNPPVRDKPLC